MFERDREIIEESLRTFNTRHSFCDRGNSINPYASKKIAQTKCKHMWENDTDAIYLNAKGKRRCAICGKEF